MNFHSPPNNTGLSLQAKQESKGKTYKKVTLLFIIVSLAWIPVLLDPDVVSRTTNLFLRGGFTNPYFFTKHAVTIYLWTPIVILSTFILFLSPGLYLSVALNSSKKIGRWILTAFALSILTISGITACLQSLLGVPIRGRMFCYLVGLISLVCFGLLLFRIFSGFPIRWGLNQPRSTSTLVSMALIPFLLLIIFAPKFFFENFNGDGIHAFEASRLLLVQPLPFWPTSAGDIASFPGVTSMLIAYPGSWFIRTFGEIEASARLPVLLYLVVLFCVIIELAELQREKLLRIEDKGLIWLGLIIYFIVMAFSATYSPYSADIALPATQDTLLMVCFLGFTFAFISGNAIWEFFFLILTLISSPNGFLLIGLWLFSLVLVWRPIPWRTIVKTTVVTLGCLIFFAIVPLVLSALSLPTPGQEYGLVALMKRFAFLQWADWQRILYLVIPCGIFPALILFFVWKRQDRIARVFTVLTMIYFGFFYFQAHISLHHFSPVMLLPLLVFWRNDFILHSQRRKVLLLATAITGIVALVISLPKSFAPDTNARMIGTFVDNRIQGYKSLNPEVFKGSDILHNIFPYGWDPRVPKESYGGSPLVLNYYSFHFTGLLEDTNYVIQKIHETPPPGTKLMSMEGNFALFVRSESIMASHKAIRPSAPVGSPIFSIARGILFRSVPLTEGPPIINVVELLKRHGIDIESLLNRLGISIDNEDK
jgi:hypothetical protein